MGITRIRLEVPDNASRVTFTLESVDPDVACLDLYVRFGEDNDRSGHGRVVFGLQLRGILTGNGGDRHYSGNPIRRFEPEPTSYRWESLIRASSPCARSRRKWNVTERTPPPTSDGTLTPSQPVSFQRGPVDNPTIFFGNHSFRLEVPEDASRVTFTLESDVDVELAVRYGEDNAVEDRLVVTDHRSRNPAGNERILITARSDPPLRSGTYFVSVVLMGHGGRRQLHAHGGSGT